MKAIIYERYGSPEVLELREIPKPSPKKNEVLVRINATTVTAGDWRMRKADPFVARLFNGLFKPKRIKILGFELAGVIEEIGKDVQSFKKADHIFASCGLRFGAYAEYTCLKESDLIAIKPSNMTFEEAATVPTGGLTALRFLKQCGVAKDVSVLIYGASGSVGTFAVQIARAYGAKITAVCSAPNIAMVKQLGAHNVIDYTTENVLNINTRFDIIFNAVGKGPKLKSLLKTGGKFASVQGSPRSNLNDMLVLKELIEAGKLTTVIDRTYTLEQIREAHAYVESFRKKGNVVVKVLST